MSHKPDKNKLHSYSKNSSWIHETSNTTKVSRELPTIANPEISMAAQTIKQSTTTRYQAYNFSLESLTPFIEKLESTNLSKKEHAAVTKQLQEAWDRMLAVARHIYNQNLTCPTCGDDPFGARNMHQQTMTCDYERKRDAAYDFVYFEDKYLESDRGSDCQGLHALRHTIEELRKNAKTPPRLPTQGKPATSDLKEGARPGLKSADIPIRTVDRDPLTLDATRPPRPYTSYHILSMDSFKVVKGLGGQEQRDAIDDRWVGMYRTAQKNWDLNMTCPVCKEPPGESGGRHKYSEAVWKVMDRIMNDLFDIGAGVLTQEALDGFRDRLYGVENMYLRDNMETRCDGLQALKRDVRAFRDSQTF
ncbi:hypothetical protein EG329_007662 [Mollisiaceae sp. DMI_Dod_QoI]|nr:hypothetical protein EG329_007662 [Helotiales sp. DMI_Dod_QoI]